MNLKGALGDVLICDDISSSKSWVVSSDLPQQSGGSIPLPTPPAFVAFPHLPILKIEVLFTYDPRTYAYLTKHLDITLGAKAHQSLARTKI